MKTIVLILLNIQEKFLNLAIKKGGSSIRDFKNIVGKNGSFQDNFKVYNRENKSCLSLGCKGTIKKNLSLIDQHFFVIFVKIKIIILTV